MQFSKSAIAAVFAGVASLASAQYGTETMGSEPTGTAPAQATGSVQVWVVKVGENKGLTFTPNNLQGAKKGDMVQFQFMSGNHSVVQSTFKEPCVPMTGDKEGFFSGYMPMNSPEAMAKGMPTFTIMVEDETKPIWFYCSQGKHCENGMLGAINAPATGNTLKAYTDAAKNVAESKAPSSAEGGQSGSTDGSSSEGGSQGGSMTGMTTMATATPTGDAAAASGAVTPTIAPGSGSNPAFSSPKLTVLFAAVAAIALLA